VLRLSADGNLRFITFLPVPLPSFGNPFAEDNTPYTMFVDSTGSFGFAGYGAMDSGLTTADALAQPWAGYYYLVIMNGQGSDVLYATNLPSAPGEPGIYRNGITTLVGIAHDGNTNIYFTGSSYSPLLVPTNASVLQAVSSLYPNGFIGKIDLSKSAPACSYSISSIPAASIPIDAGTGQITILTGPECPWQLNGSVNNSPLNLNTKLRLTAAPNLATSASGNANTVASLATGVGPGTIAFAYGSRRSDGDPAVSGSAVTTAFRLYGRAESAKSPSRISMTR